MRLKRPQFPNYQRHIYSTDFLASKLIGSQVGQSAGGKAMSQTGEPTMVMGLFKVTAQQEFASVKTTVAKLGAELSECVGPDFRSSM